MAEPARRDFYAILGVPETAGREELTRAYRFLAKAFHPDRFTDPAQQARAEAHFKLVSEAYRALSDPTRRRAYDRDRHSARPVGDSPQPLAWTDRLVEEFVKAMVDRFLPRPPRPRWKR